MAAIVKECMHGEIGTIAMDVWLVEKRPSNILATGYDP
jgi:hypothetical protein